MTSKLKIAGLDPHSGYPVEVTVEDGLVARIEKITLDTDLYLSAGLVDLQVNGFSGLDLNAEELSVETVIALAQAMPATGVTCFAPTLITASEEAICYKLRVIAEARRSHPKVAACIPWVHVEGPSISPVDGYRGAHRAEDVRPPSLAELEKWQMAAGGLVGMVTLSPHFEESAEYIARLTQSGVHVAIGHTHASPEQIKRAIDAGARLSTHLGSGIAPEIPRHRNPIWPQLADERLTATFIGDGHHLPEDVLAVMLRAKTLARSVLVSDLVALAGLPAGLYTTPVGGRVELRSDGRLCVAGSELLAGSAATLAQCIGRVMRMTGLALADVLTMATENPGRFAGGRGRLTVGSRADIVRFRWRNELKIADVWLAGEQVYGS